MHTYQNPPVESILIPLICMPPIRQAPMQQSVTAGTGRTSPDPQNNNSTSSDGHAAGSSSSSRGSTPPAEGGLRAPPRAALVITALAGYDGYYDDSAGSSEISRITPLRVQVRASQGGESQHERSWPSSQWEALHLAAVCTQIQFHQTQPACFASTPE